MAGPDSKIYPRVSLAAAADIILQDMIRIKSKLEGNSVRVATTLPIGGSYNGIERPFLIDLNDSLKELEEPENFYNIFDSAFGFRPNSEIIISAMSNDQNDHRILAEISLSFAEQTNGIIDMCGLIMPKTVFQTLPNLWRAHWFEVQQAVEAFTQTIPGTAIAVPYQVDEEREWAYHVVDSTFLRAWLEHPEFRMIK